MERENWLTEDAILLCAHLTGRVANKPSQALVTINGRRVLVSADPEARAISNCSNAAPPLKPCLATLRVEKGYSELLSIDGKKICLGNVTGKTDGTPPGTVYYHVKTAGQELVTGI